MTVGTSSARAARIEKQLGHRADRMLRIEQRLPGDLTRPRAAGLANDDRIDAACPHALGQRLRQRRLARPLRALEDDEEPACGHPSVMMLLVAPFSMPSLICWFTLAISFSKFDRATTYAWPTGLISRSRTAFS